MTVGGALAGFLAAWLIVALGIAWNLLARLPHEAPTSDQGPGDARRGRAPPSGVVMGPLHVAALAASIRRIDKDADGAISRDELQARFEALDAQSDLVAVSVTVVAKGRPLPEAKVTLTPAPFMGEG